jgi:hypothetical protein
MVVDMVFCGSKYLEYNLSIRAENTLNNRITNKKTNQIKQNRSRIRSNQAESNGCGYDNWVDVE